MEQHLTLIRNTRARFVELIDSLSEEELNQIPEGFRNNIAWNFGHIVVSTPSLCYLRTEVKYSPADIPFIEAYKKGSKPEYWISMEEIQELKKGAFSWIEQIEADAKTDLFKQITPFSTSTYHYEMRSIEEVIACSAGHDSLHYGYALAQAKLVRNQVTQHV